MNICNTRFIGYSSPRHTASFDRTFLFLMFCRHVVQVKEMERRQTTLRTQYSKLLKPEKSGSAPKPLTARARWILRVMDFLKRHIAHRRSTTTVSDAFKRNQNDQIVSVRGANFRHSASNTHHVASHAVDMVAGQPQTS